MFQNGAGELHESVGSAKRQEAALILWAGAQQMQARLAAVSRCFDFESFHRHSFAAMSFDADPCGWTDPALPVEFIQRHGRSEEHTSELQSLMRLSYAVFCLKKKNLFP